MSGGTLAVTGILTLSLAANAYFAVAGRTRKFMAELTSFLRRSSAGRPDLASQFPTASARAANAAIGASLNTFISKLGENIKRTFSVGYHLTAASDSMKQVSGRLQDLSDKLSSQASQVATAMEQMNSTITEIARNAATAAKAGASSTESAGQAEKTIAENVKSIEVLSENVTHWAETNQALSAATDRIDKIILVINDIAGQTNLLALNAAIEAARAGEQGRGFAVVADEVRKLADKTGAATREISEMIKDVKEKADNSLHTMDATLKQVKDNIDRSRHAEASLRKISAEVRQTVDMVTQIATAAEEQSQVAEDVLRNTELVSGHASETKELAGAISHSGETVASHAHSLYSQLCSVKKDATDRAMEELLRSGAESLSGLLEEALRHERIAQASLFDERYAANGEAGKFTTQATRHFEAEVLPLLAQWSQADRRITYVVAMDRNGYMPAHVNPARARVKMDDPVSLAGARSTTIVGQAFRRPVAAGGELVVDIAAPLTVSGRHWGCLRIGYLPDMVE